MNMWALMQHKIGGVVRGENRERESRKHVAFGAKIDWEG